MKINLNSFFVNNLYYFKDNGLALLTDRQKKITLIFSLAVGVFVLCLTAARYFLKIKSQEKDYTLLTSTSPGSGENSTKVNQIKSIITTEKNLSSQTAKQNLEKLSEKMVQEIYALKGKDEEALKHTAMPYKFYFDLTLGELQMTLCDLSLNLTALKSSEKTIKQTLGLLSKDLGRKILIIIPTLNLDKTFSIDWANHLYGAKMNLSCLKLLTEKEYFNQFESSFGKKGDWFLGVFHLVKNIIDHNFLELEKFSKSMDVIFKDLDELKVSYFLADKENLKKQCNELHIELEKLKNELKIIECAANSFEKIIDLTDN